MVVPEHCGKRTLAGTIDEIASSSPHRVWARYPTSPEAFEHGEFRQVTFAILANAVNRLAWHLKTTLPDSRLGDSVAYIGPSDIRYFVLACAASKCRLRALFFSPRNNLESHLGLMEQTDCQVLLQPKEKPQDQAIGSILQQRPMKTIDMPTIDQLLDKTAVDHFTFDIPWSDAVHQPFLTLHTSGSTGLPKPIDINHGLISTIDAQQMLADVDGRSVTARAWANRTVYTALPPFHSAAINFFTYSVFQSTELLFGPSNQPPSVRTVEQILDTHVTSAGVMAPSLLAEILGSTETFNIPELIPQSIDEWPYHSYHPSLGIEFQPREGLCELVFVQDPALLRHQGAFWAFPDLDEYPMKDLYEENPCKPGLWTNRGRLDDIVVLSNGEKLNPSGAERIIAQNPLIRSALIVGNAQTQPALLVKPVKAIDKSRAKDKVAEILPDVQRANETLPSHGQLHTSHIQVLETPDQFLRSSKGEVRRAATADALGNVVADLYESANTYNRSSVQLDFTSEQALLDSLLEVMAADSPDGRRLEPDQSFFDYGFDSLRVMKVLREIKASVRELRRSPAPNLTPRLIYQNHTPVALSRKLMAVVGKPSMDVSDTENSQDEMETLLDSFKARISDLDHSQQSGHVVLLTGSTGSLGSYVLDNLVRSPSVKQIVCLNRHGSGVDRQKEINRSRALAEDFSKVQFLEADMMQARFGLDNSQYTDLIRKTSHIIHSAWPVNFNLPLSSFEPQLEACHNLVELATASHNQPEIIFVSSVGAANNWPRISQEQVPERCITDFNAPEPMGYAQSKQLAELLFAHAHERLGVPVTICRVGQVAGPVRSAEGMWSKNEWFPSLISSCKPLGVVPDSLGCMDCMDWIPVDLLGEALVEIVLREKPTMSSSPILEDASGAGLEVDARIDSAVQSRAVSSVQLQGSSGDLFKESQSTGSGEGPRFLHLVNPQKAQWQDVAAQVAPMLGDNLQVVPYKEWLHALTTTVDSANEFSDIPAAKLVEFFNEIGADGAKRPVFACDAAQKCSSTLRNLPPVSTEWLGRWIRQWNVAVK